jgi:excisionase family DNA binding protein
MKRGTVELIGEAYGTDTDNDTRYALTCNMIRDFCKDAIAIGKVPTDGEIDRCVWRYAIDRTQQEAEPADQMSLMLKPTEAARIAGVSTRTITRMCEQGQLQAVRLRGAWRINRTAFIAQLGVMR